LTSGDPDLIMSIPVSELDFERSRQPWIGTWQFDEGD